MECENREVHVHLQSRVPSHTCYHRTMKIWRRAGKGDTDPTVLATIGSWREQRGNVAWSPDGEFLAMLIGGELKVWSLPKSRIVLDIKHIPALNEFVIDWSPASERLALSSKNKLLILHIKTGKVDVFLEHHDTIQSAAWSPNGHFVATGSADKSVRLLDLRTSKSRVFQQFKETIFRIRWFADCGRLAYGSMGQVGVLDTISGEIVWEAEEHRRLIKDIAISPSEEFVASCADQDPTVRIWNPISGKLLKTLEGHTGSVNGLAFSFDTRFLATKATDSTVGLWRCDTWQCVHRLPQQKSFNWRAGVSFHPSRALLACFDDGAHQVQVWDLPMGDLPSSQGEALSYRNVKILLLGDTGVGKTGLGLVMSGHAYQPTDSTHARNVWLFSRSETEDGQALEIREVYLWDMPGQPGYRLVHQLHLRGSALALILFDARSESEPFAGVRHWVKAVKEAERSRAGSSSGIKKILVSARVDRGGVPVSRQRLQELMTALELDGHIETSAKEGWGIEELTTVISSAIQWGDVPQVISSRLLQDIHIFIVDERVRGRRMTSSDELYRSFLHSTSAKPSDELRQQFEGALGCLEARDLIRRLSFGNQLLLQPAILDGYASAIVNAAKEEPDGLGFISEHSVLKAEFRMPEHERLTDRRQEDLLLVATVEDLLRHELVIREESEAGSVLIFPTQFLREAPERPAPDVRTIMLRFDGPLLNIYATLVVRLSRSGAFRKRSMWRNAATFTAIHDSESVCGLYMREVEEGSGELMLFFENDPQEATRDLFEHYVHLHLERRAVPGSILRKTPFVCASCKEPLTDRQVERRRGFGYSSIACPVCMAQIDISIRETPVGSSTTKLSHMDRSADRERDRVTAASVIRGKRMTNSHDVFLCHNGADKLSVRQVADQLTARGILPWLDEQDLRPGRSFARALESEIARIPAVAVCVGASGIGPWQHSEYEAFLREYATRGLPIIPVILSDAPNPVELPLFLKAFTWVDLRVEDPDPIDRLIWGITGLRS